jgi:hypothetical protein
MTVYIFSGWLGLISSSILKMRAAKVHQLLQVSESEQIHEAKICLGGANRAVLRENSQDRTRYIIK